MAQTLSEYAKRRYSLAGGELLADFNPYFVPVDLLQQQCEADGLAFLNFAQYDYLAIGNDHRRRSATADAIRTFGTGAGGSRLVGGEWSVHRELEVELARFIGTQDALALVSGYGTNLALVGHLLTTGDLLIVDEYAHNSIMLGTKLSRADSKVFAHNDLDELAAILEANRGNYSRVLVVVEGLYSMEGDVPELPRLLEICERYRAWVMIDEAHSIGVLGKSGRGICEHFGIDSGRIDLVVGTMSKAFAACGGFICAKSPVIQWLRYTLPGFVYSVGIPPHLAVAVQSALSIVGREPGRVSQLQNVSRYFLDTAIKQGFDVGSAIGAGIVPIKFKDALTTMRASQALLDDGIYVPPIVQVGVPKDMPRLRFFLSSRHTKSEIDRVFEVLTRWRNQQETGPRATRLSLSQACEATSEAGVP